MSENTYWAELAGTLFEEAGDALFLFDPESEQVLDVNPMAQRLSGYPRRELRTLKTTYLFRSEVEGGMHRFRQAFRRTGLFHSQEGFWLRHQRDGVWVPVNLTVTRLHVEPRPLGLITARDISEQRDAFNRLEKAEAELRRLMASISDCVWSAEREASGKWVYRFISPVVEKISGRPADYFLPDPERWVSIIHPDDRSRMQQVFAQTAMGQRNREESEYRIVWPDGTVRWVRGSVLPSLDAGGKVRRLDGVFSDITERKLLEDQLRQAQKMEAVGQLAGGIAHDFNNLLTGILGNLALAMGDIAPGHPCRPLLDNAESAGLRAAELIQQLLGFSRRTPLRPVPLDVNASIDETLRLMRHVIDPRIAVATRTERQLWKVRADSSQIVQVLMNLCLNARDAMPQGGRLTLETANVVLDGPSVATHRNGQAGEVVRLRVSDTGHGIAAEIQKHLFEPFFTTKEPGKGTGLGLAMVFGIVQQHGGWVECTSAPDKGATFDIYLPRLPASAEVAGTLVPGEGVRGGPETILLVDDEELVGRVGQAILERYGYQVVTAANGREAIALYTERPDAIDLVILDMAMPELSGPDTLRQLRHIDPAVRVLISSGYCSEEDLQEVKRNGAMGFIAKPYRPMELARSVRAVMDQPMSAEVRTR